MKDTDSSMGVCTSMEVTSKPPMSKRNSHNLPDKRILMEAKTGSRGSRNGNLAFDAHALVAALPRLSPKASDDHCPTIDDMKKRLIGSQNGRLGLTGLKNLGNTCFMNSALQCLSNTLPLTEYFVDFIWEEEINEQNVLGSGGLLVKAYASLVNQLWFGKSDVVSPTQFKEELGRIAPQFKGYGQHDSQELLALLLDGLHEDLNRVTKKVYIEDVESSTGDDDEKVSAEAWRRYLTRNRSIIVDLFQGQLKSTLKCKRCSHLLIKFEPFMYLSLPVRGDNLKKCLEAFTEEEHLDGDNCWYCPKCKTHVEATKKFDLWKLPAILIIHLKRFKVSNSGSRSKINDNIAFPLMNFDMRPMIKSPQREPPTYDLFAVSNHHGTMSGGHYTSFAKNFVTGKWYEYNDSVCSETKAAAVQSSAAYFLFFNRVTEKDGKTIPGRYRRQSLNLPHLWPHLSSEELDDTQQRRL